MSEMPDNCLLSSFPEVAKEWNYEKNEGLSPTDVTPGSKKKVWWKCKLGHEWQSEINKRTKRQNGCPFCSGHRILTGFNDLATTNPELAEEWDYEKNGEKTPYNLSRGHSTKVWWKCKAGHGWLASVNQRVTNNTGCPYCSGRRAVPGETDIVTTHPALMKEWDYSKNLSIDPSEVKAGSNKKVYWICKFGHSYQAIIANRALYGRGCPYCANKKLLRGFNDFATLYPSLLSEWNYSKNLAVQPTEIIGGCSKSVWWKCIEGHEWTATVNSRVGGSGCPYCSGNKVLKGYNDLLTINKELSKEWHPYKNGELTPADVTRGCNKKIWWLGKCGHEWQASVSDRTQGRGCPFCAGKTVRSGNDDRGIIAKEKSLAVNYPKIASEWHPSKNGSLDPMGITEYSNKIVWWLGKCGHEWKASVNNRTGRNNGCPICSNHQLLEGYNDLESRFPSVAQDWNYSKNSCKPNEVGYGSGKSVWWICHRCGHEWKTSIASRTRLLSGCPKCYGATQISRAEKTIAYYLKKAGIEIEENYLIFKNYSLDIYIPSMKVAIEYDGQQWHKKIERDLEKDRMCEEQGIVLYRIREPKLESLNSTSLEIRVPELSNSLGYLNSVIRELFSELKISFTDIDVERDEIDILSYLEQYIINNSIVTTNQELLNEWNYEKNKDLKPDYFTKGSDVKVWWLCSKGHDYKASINNRVNGTGCPYCSGKKVLPGFNDLETQYPLVAAEWDIEKNGELLPKQVLSHSNKMYWWKCQNGHSWEARIQDRTSKQQGCPYCSRTRAIVGENDFQTEHPDLAMEWCYEKNGDQVPSAYLSGSGKRVWWECKQCGTNYKSSIADRVRGRGCPKCGIIKRVLTSRKTRIAINGSLFDLNRKLAEEWDYSKNRDFSPRDIELNSNKKIWWLCDKGHSYLATPNARNAGSGCPYCANKKVLKGYNDLGTTHPELLKEWDYENNGELLPEMVVSGSPKKVWWKCHLGHIWMANISSRSSGYGCPVCSGKIVLKGFNDLQTLRPELAAEWNHDRNESKPEEFTIGSNKKVWWKCNKGHEWETTIGLRTSQNTQCPYCSGRKVLKGYNDLQSTYPALASEWDQENNGDLLPDEVVYGSGKRDWWKCPRCQNRWIASIVNRTSKKSGCSKCGFKWADEAPV